MGKISYLWKKRKSACKIMHVFLPRNILAVMNWVWPKFSVKRTFYVVHWFYSMTFGKRLTVQTQAMTSAEKKPFVKRGRTMLVALRISTSFVPRLMVYSHKRKANAKAMLLLHGYFDFDHYWLADNFSLCISLSLLIKAMNGAFRLHSHGEKAIAKMISLSGSA